jgi:hypothetical protein
MAYTIDRYNNTQLAVVEDGTIDQTTDLKLVGKNYAGYGEIQNENFVFLLENFAGSSAPPRALSGQLWFDSANSKLKFWDGFQWRTTGGAEVSTSVPTGLKVGDFWWDSANEQLYSYNGTDYVLIGPQSAGSGQTQIVSRSVTDTLGNSRGVITGVVNDEAVFVVSSQGFEINTAVTTYLPGFDVIRQGITLKNTIGTSGGVTSGDWRFWGTASNSEKLGGLSASSYITTQSASFGSLASFSDSGLQVGDSGDLKLKIELDNQAVIANEVGTQLVFRTKDVNGSIKNPVRLFADSIRPGFVPGTETASPPTDAVTTIGTVDHTFSAVYATNFYGTSEKSNSLIVGAEERTGSESASTGTVAVRTSADETINGQTITAGALKATYFVGTATQAQYADLAEKYSTPEELPFGTVVAVCKHEGHDVEAANVGDIAIGVVSTEPALMMNSEAEGQYIGLKGRLPVRVIGAVKKGQAVYVDNNGCASTSINGGSLVGIALETNEAQEEKLVECVLKV